MPAAFCFARTSDDHQLVLRNPPPAVIVVLPMGGVVPDGHPWVDDASGGTRYALERVDVEGVYQYVRLEEQHR